MATDTLSTLRRLEASVLTEVVRQDQREPELEIADWTVGPLSNKGVINPTDPSYLNVLIARARAAAP